jgi:hypothetical protein
LQDAVRQLDISENGLNRIYGLQGCPENFLSLLSHGYPLFGLCRHRHNLPFIRILKSLAQTDRAEIILYTTLIRLI